MTKTNVILALAVGAATFAAWAGAGLRLDAPARPVTVDGLAYAPSGSRPGTDAYPTPAEIEADLTRIAEHAASVRTYSLDGTLARVPDIASRLGLDVTLGVWLGDGRDADAHELARLDDVLARNGNVTRVIVGNETLLREDLDAAELGRLLDELRAGHDVAIGTAEPWHVWLEHPELATHVDFLAVHALPYWDGVHVGAAVDFVANRVAELEAAHPDKPIVVAEAGWPTAGRSRGAAIASRANADRFLRAFLARAERDGYAYFVMEAFDQPWKRAGEGRVGAHWGLYDAERRPKLTAAGGPRFDGLGLGLALVAALGTIAAFSVLVTDARGLRLGGRVFLAGVAATLVSGLVAGLDGYFTQYWTAPAAAGAVALIAGVLGIVALVLVEAHEWAEARTCAIVRASTAAPTGHGGRALPRVSIHVPAYEEPPGMLIETLASLAALDYPDYEVIVVDNNTRDARLWRPIEAFCNARERFRFFHVAPLAGHKAGALNFARERTAADAELVAVVDSDYVVDPGWLRDLVPAFADPGVAIAQAPQAYRDQAAGTFKSLCDAEYRGFFEIGMVTRNAHNAIIQHGTMTLVRRSVLDDVGGWAEWTITEDAELGLRVLESGHRALYTQTPYGRGLTPDNFLDYKAQRYRWAFGAVQILRRHARELLGLQPSALTRRQRFHFVAGWLGWLADGGNLAVNAAAVGWSALMIASPERFLAPLAPFTVFVLALFGFKLVKQAALYRANVGARLTTTLGALTAGLALVFTVGQAVLTGLVRRSAPFRRTPKLAHRHTIAGAVAAARCETALAAALVASAAGVAATTRIASIDRTLWCVLLVVLAVPHLAALGLSLASARRSATGRARVGAAAPDLRRG